MSAFTLSDNHICAIADFIKDCIYAKSTIDAIRGNAPEKEARVFDRMSNFELVATVLRAQNDRSVNYRYKASVPFESRCDFIPKPPKNKYSAVEILKAAKCYDYQSNETLDWDSTSAKELSKLTQELAISKLPGYEEAAWGIE